MLRDLLLYLECHLAKALVAVKFKFAFITKELGPGGVKHVHVGIVDFNAAFSIIIIIQLLCMIQLGFKRLNLYLAFLDIHLQILNILLIFNHFSASIASELVLKLVQEGRARSQLRQFTNDELLIVFEHFLLLFKLFLYAFFKLMKVVSESSQLSGGQCLELHDYLLEPLLLLKKLLLSLPEVEGAVDQFSLQAGVSCFLFKLLFELIIVNF